MSTPEGRRNMARIIYRVCRLKALTATGERESQSFNEGQRSVAAAIEHELISVCPSEYFLMERERLDAEQQALSVATTDRLPSGAEPSRP